MTVSRGNYNIFVQLTPCRVVATSNQAGTYFNGPSNNGVNATLTVSSLTIDSVDLVAGDSVLLMAQTAANQNGIYFVADADAMILQRRNDFQSAEQIQPGAFIPVAAGTLNAGSMYVVVEPLPGVVGIDDLVITASPLNSGLGTAATKAASDNTKADVASVDGATTVGHLASFADTAGTVVDSTIVATNVQLKSQVKAGTSPNLTGSAGGPYTVTVAGLTAASVVVATVEASANAGIYVLQASAGTGNFDVLLSGDPGATCTVNYVAYIAAQ